MKLVLTDAVSGKEIVCDSDMMRVIEPTTDASGNAATHIAFASDQGRIVKELAVDIASIIGVTAVPAPPAPVTPVAPQLKMIAAVAVNAAPVKAKKK